MSKRSRRDAKKRRARGPALWAFLKSPLGLAVVGVPLALAVFWASEGPFRRAELDDRDRHLELETRRLDAELMARANEAARLALEEAEARERQRKNLWEERVEERRLAREELELIEEWLEAEKLANPVAAPLAELLLDQARHDYLERVELGASASPEDRAALDAAVEQLFPPARLRVLGADALEAAELVVKVFGTADQRRAVESRRAGEGAAADPRASGDGGGMTGSDGSPPGGGKGGAGDASDLETAWVSARSVGVRVVTPARVDADGHEEHVWRLRQELGEQAAAEED